MLGEAIIGVQLRGNAGQQHGLAATARGDHENVLAR